MTAFRPFDRKTRYLLPPSVEEWLPEDHLARFIVEVVDELDVSRLANAYAGRGSAAYHPSLLLSLLVYGYATGVFSSRKIERATYDSVAFRYIAAGNHPDHDTLATFRRRFLGELSDLFVQVLAMAKEMKLLKLGTVSLDGTKVHANASRHSALSHGHIEKIETHLKGEVQELLALAEQADRADIPDGVSLPAEIKRREDRLAAMAAAKAKIEARAQERFEHEQTAYEAKIAEREAKAQASGKKPGGKPPTPDWYENYRTFAIYCAVGRPPPESWNIAYILGSAQGITLPSAARTARKQRPVPSVAPRHLPAPRGVTLKASQRISSD